MTFEDLPAPPERIEFSQLRVGDEITVTTGEGSEAYKYTFTVQDNSERRPSGTLQEESPDGTINGSTPFVLYGCGSWTTPEQNPVQHDLLAGKYHPGRAFTPYYDGLIVGRFMWGKAPGHDELLVFDKPGQEISALQLETTL